MKSLLRLDMAAAAPRTPSPRSKRSFEGRKMRDRSRVRKNIRGIKVVRQANTARSRPTIQRAWPRQPPTLYPPTSRDIARRTLMQLCMIACSLVHIAYARSTNIDPSAAGALRGNFSQPTQECCLGAPEAAHPLLAGSRLYSACEPNGWATFNLLVLAPDHLNRDGGGNKEVTGLSSGSDNGHYFDHAALPCDSPAESLPCSRRRPC